MIYLYLYIAKWPALVLANISNTSHKCHFFMVRHLRSTTLVTCNYIIWFLATDIVVCIRCPEHFQHLTKFSHFVQYLLIPYTLVLITTILPFVFMSFIWLDSTYKWYRILVFLWPISLSIMPLTFMKIVANDRILFFSHSWIRFPCVKFTIVCIRFFTHASIERH